MAREGAIVGSALGSLIGAGIGGIFTTAVSAAEGMAAVSGAAIAGAATGVVKHLETPQTPPQTPQSKLRDASPLSTKKQSPRASATARPDALKKAQVDAVLAVSEKEAGLPCVVAEALAQGGPVTAPQLQAARSLHAVQVQGINYCIGCMPGQEKCRSTIDTVAPGTPISDPFFPDAMLQMVHPNGRLEAKGVWDVSRIFPQVLSQMEVMLEWMECRVLSDELGPCVDMAVAGRYSQNGSAPRPVYVLSRCREHMASGGLRTAQMRWVFQ